jgi:hypothetical protein
MTRLTAIRYRPRKANANQIGEVIGDTLLDVIFLGVEIDKAREPPGWRKLELGLGGVGPGGEQGYRKCKRHILGTDRIRAEANQLDDKCAAPAAPP